jgi:hypothetical protein
MKVAIVIFVIGDKYIQSFNSFFKNSVEKYCKKYNYDLIILTELINKNINHNYYEIIMQKILIPNKYKTYDFVVVLDSDIYINGNAPPLPFSQIPNGKVGCVNERKYLGNYEWREKVQLDQGWEKTGKDWYKMSNSKNLYNDHPNTGMMIYQPKYHGEILEKLYYDNINQNIKYHQGDQGLLSIFLMENEMIHWLDERYNRIWFFWKEILYPLYNGLPDNLKQILMYNYIELNYFCHFTSMGDVNILQQLQKNNLL